MQTASHCPVPVAAAHPALAALDDPLEWQSYSRAVPGQDGLWESSLAVLGMHCAACAMTLEQLLGRLPGMHSVRVSGASAMARLVWSPQASRPSAWAAALAGSGYALHPAGDPQLLRLRERARRLLLWRWLVAGFCMMQVMMYAFPAYIAASGDITPDMQSLLRWASWVLTLPVMLFSCSPFFSSAWSDLRRRRIGMDVPVALGLLLAFGASSAATFDPSGVLGDEVWFDSVTMFVFFLLSGRLLEARLRSRSAGALQAELQRMPESVERLAPDGSFERVAVRRLVPGDTIRVLPGDVIAADATVLEGSGSVDEAMLTGESRPLKRSAGDPVIAGSNNLDGMLRLRVERSGAQTRHAALVALMEQAALEKPELAQLADRIASPFLLLVLAASALAVLWWWPSGPAQAIGVALSVLIVTCPCALSLATPAATLASAGALARQGVLVRRLAALDGSAAVDTVGFDKTGTLTGERMRIVAATQRAGVTFDQALELAAALAQHSLHPASRAIMERASATPAPAREVTVVAGQGIGGVVAAGPGVCAGHLWLGSAALCRVPAPQRDPVRSQVHLADSQGWLASFTLGEELRADSVQAVRALGALGVQVELLSGDRLAAVRRVAALAGISRFAGECGPEDKLLHVRRLQQQGRRVAMVGDGMNDAAVLAGADVSLAMAQAAATARCGADIVLMGNAPSTVPMLLLQARRTRSVVRQNLGWAALYNLICIPLALMGQMPPWLAGLGMASSSLLVVLNSARLAQLPRVAVAAPAPAPQRGLAELQESAR